MNDSQYDIAIVGAGIVGLAHALAAARRNLRVLVLDRETRPIGASIRNFGFITVTGQSDGVVWKRARRSREVWAELAGAAGIPVIHRNECLIVHSSEALRVLQEFMDTEMGTECELLTAAQVEHRVPMAEMNHVCGALWSPHELRIEARTAIPALVAHLREAFGVTFEHGVNVCAISTPEIETNAGIFRAGRVVVAPGPDLATLFPEKHAQRGVRLCKLQMLRYAPQPNGWELPASIMSDFGLIRYQGYSALPAAEPLRRKLEVQDPEAIAYGIHLIVVQSGDGSLVVGDSHEYAYSPDPFYSMRIEEAVRRLANSVLKIPNQAVTERWIGAYPQSKSCEWFVDAVDSNTRLVQVTSGNGMSTSFGFAEEVVADLCNSQS